MMNNIQIKRIYEFPDEKDGLRVLVDRLWPRGVCKDDGRVDVWAKILTPTSDLRKWFSHDPEKWEEFKHRYTMELKSRYDEIKALVRSWEESKNITLLYAAKSKNYNHALILKDFLQQL